MSQLPIYIDVVVPLPLPNLLTYAAGDDDLHLEPGMRVVVQVGAKKRYTAVIWAVHNRPPQHYAARPIESVIDSYPVVTATQRAFWDWIADYYMCTRGEVMSAALPSGMKLDSQTRLIPHPDRSASLDRVMMSELDERAILLFEAIWANRGIQLLEASAIVDLKNPQRLINQLLEKGLIVIEEEWKERYRPKKHAYVHLHPKWQSEGELNGLLDKLERRAPIQARLLLAYLDEAERAGSGWNHFIPLSVIREKSGVEASVAKTMVEREILVKSHQTDSNGSVSESSSMVLPQLSGAQLDAYRKISSSQEEDKMVLLHGVTGSGKTEVYIHLIADALEAGKTVLFLVPEIALTTQLIQRLEVHFKRFLQVYHSRYTTRERTETWLEVLGKGNANPRAQLVVGPRSALLLPFQQLGLIIVDEEHESSFKQHDPAPRYHARDAAMWLARQSKAHVVLGSATPSIETHWLADEGKINRVLMTERYGGMLMPEIWCADLKKAHRQRAMHGHFSRLLKTEMELVLDSGRQVILFQNRRGFSPMWQCGMCAWVPQCERCDVPLTLHKWKNELNCHHCGYNADPPPQTCTSCGKRAMEPKGLGTERIEEEIKELFPKARVARMDWDTTRSKHAHARLVQAFASQQFDILVGTQMVSKGLDFAHVGLVGVLSADRMLNFPDFRSFERAFQMLTQVAGRAGRSGQRGKVILQTYNPDHWVLTKVMANDYAGLVKQELIERKNYKYPPFDRLIRLTLKHSDVQRVETAAQVLSSRLQQRFQQRVIGPETPMISRINDLHHRIILLKFERELNPTSYKPYLQEDLDAFMSDARFKRIRLTVDVDPA